MLNKVLLNINSFCLSLDLYDVHGASDVSVPPPLSPSHSHTPTHAHKRSALPCSGFLNLSLSLFLCLPVWVEFNRVLWCERDVSLKNIRHQRSLLRWSGISSCAHSAQSGSWFPFETARQFQKLLESKRVQWSEFGYFHYSHIFLTTLVPNKTTHFWGYKLWMITYQ